MTDAILICLGEVSTFDFCRVHSIRSRKW